MEQVTRQKILSILDQHRLMTIATLRPDGWPQATTVGYAHKDLTLYFCCGHDSQKTSNLLRDNRVSLAITSDPDQVMEIKALSMAARAETVEDLEELAMVSALLQERYPWQEGTPEADGVPMQEPPEENTRVFRVTPEVISLIDYSKGFGHTELVRC